MDRKGFAVYFMLVCCLLGGILFASSSFAYIRDSEFFEMCRNGTLKEINDAFLEGVNVNARSEGSDDTPLMAAAAGTADAEVIKALIQAGADISRYNFGGETPLSYAARYNLNQKVVKSVITALVDAGCDVNAKDGSGRTPLFWAVSSINSEAVMTLLSLGADAKERDSFGTRPIDVAESKKEFRNTETIRKLREASK